MKIITYELIDPSGPTPGIRCLICLSLSLNQNHVEQRFCGRCLIFHNTIAERIAEASRRGAGLPADPPADIDKLRAMVNAAEYFDSTLTKIIARDEQEKVLSVGVVAREEEAVALERWLAQRETEQDAASR